MGSFHSGLWGLTQIIGFYLPGYPTRPKLLLSRKIGKVWSSEPLPTDWNDQLFHIVNKEKEAYITRASPQKYSALIDATPLNYSFFKRLGLSVKSGLFRNILWSTRASSFLVVINNSPLKPQYIWLNVFSWNFMTCTFIITWNLQPLGLT